MGLLEKAQQKKPHQSDASSEVESSQVRSPVPASSQGLLQKAQQKKKEQKSEPPTPEFSERAAEKTQQQKPAQKPKPFSFEQQTKQASSPGLLQKAQQKQATQKPEISTSTEPTLEKTSPSLVKKTQKQTSEQKPAPVSSEQQIKQTSSSGLLQKAQEKQSTQKPEVSLPEQPVMKTEDIDIIEERPDLGWKKLGKVRIVYDHAINEYRYEVIEPLLNSKEQELRRELTHLFKMLANVNTFDMLQQEKEQLLYDTLEQIIVDNNICFEPDIPTDKKKQKKQMLPLEKLKQETTKTKQKQSKPLFFKKKSAQPAEETETVFLDEHSKDKIFYHLFKDFLGYGRLTLLMHDDGIEDISCDGPDTPIFIHHRKYEAIETNVYFDSENELDSFIVRLCQVSGKQISIYSPIVDGKLPDGSRLQATLARTVTKGSTFTIRKFKENPLTPVDLIGFNSLSIDMAAYFWLAIEYGASILFCGGTASGKTTVLNALSLFVPSSHKIISIEDTREVNLPHKNWIAGTTRTGFSSSEQSKTGKDIDMFDLIRAALRQRPRVIIVGEVRGREAYSLFQAMATGHTSYATVHASDIHTLIQRLENPPISLPRALLTSLDIIVFQNAVDISGKMVRRMTSVTEIIKLDSDTNQLIFMAPFTWLSKTDDRFEASKTSKIITRIRQQNDWTEERMEEELANRIRVLEWMKVKNYRSYTDVGRIIAEYQKYPDRVLKRIQEDTA